jgi:hypothetical protein
MATLPDLKFEDPAIKVIVPVFFPALMITKHFPCHAFLFDC